MGESWFLGGTIDWLQKGTAHVFGFFKSLLKPRGETTPAPRPLDADTALQTAADLAASLEEPANFITLDPAIPSTQIDGSRIGGVPAWPEFEPWPLDDKGVPMIFLGQINFADMPPLPDFPDHGLLQIFIKADGDLGYNPKTQDPSHVVFYRKASRSLKMAPALPEDTPTSVTPFLWNHWRTTGLELTFQASHMRPCIKDWRLQGVLEGIDPSAVKPLARDLEKTHGDMWGNIGGHPRFVQKDPRGKDTEQAICLLSLGFVDGALSFGDAGEASLYISDHDLRMSNFANTAFYWDGL